MNPADIVSRGSSLSQLAKNNLCCEGPPFLKYNQSHWPKFKLQSEAIKHSIVPKLNVCTFLSTNFPKTQLSLAIISVVFIDLFKLQC